MIDPKQHILHRGLTSIRGPLIFMRNAEGVGLYDRGEVLPSEHESPRLGRVVSISGTTAVIDVFQGTEGLSLAGSRLRMLPEPILLDVGPGMLGRVYNGVGQPVDGGPAIVAEQRMRIDGEAINPIRREVPSETIGRLVLEALHGVDDVAYVRFASVYRSFRSIDEFAALLRDLQAERKGRR